MTFDGFSTVDFRPARFVSVLCWIASGDAFPFYVGQTQSIWGRLNDYYWGDFQAPTDFRVGEAIKVLNSLSVPVLCKHKATTDRQREERAIIDGLHAEGKRLLNDCRGYDYRTALQPEERIKVQDFINEIVDAAKMAQGSGSPPQPWLIMDFSQPLPFAPGLWYRNQEWPTPNTSR